MKKKGLIITGCVIGLVFLIISIGLCILKSKIPEKVYSENGNYMFYSKGVSKAMNVSGKAAISMYLKDAGMLDNYSQTNIEKVNKKFLELKIKYVTSYANIDYWKSDYTEVFEPFFTKAFPKGKIKEGYYVLYLKDNSICVTMYIKFNKKLKKQYGKTLNAISSSSSISIFDFKK